jgi:hypothetical protein
MRMIMNIKVISVVSLMLALTGCAKVPQAEIDQASLSLNEAKIAGADVYFLNDFLALQDTMNILLQKIEVEDSETVANFTAYTERLQKINERAIALKQETEAKKEVLKNEFVVLSTEVDTLILSSQQLLTSFPIAVKDGTSVLDSLNAELEGVKSTLNESNDLMSKGELLPGLEKVKMAKERAAGLHTRILTATEPKKANS